MTSRKHVIVGLSGGVDSSVAALLLLEQGYRVEGLFMKNWEDDDDETTCTVEQDLADAKQVSAELGIPLHQVNFSREYRQQVFDDCLREFAAGRTPNPDILCNQHIKFKAFLDYALRLGADLVATGHYARAVQDGNGWQLCKGRDQGKDQSYFLYTLGQAQLSRSLFPLGELEKSAVRALAEDAGFANFDKKDSTGICFIGERDFSEFLARYLPRTRGNIETTDGEIIGQHHGLAFYTLGQRQGLGIGGLKGHQGATWYVAGKDIARNALIVVPRHDHPLLLSAALDASQLSWTSGRPPADRFRCAVKTRYRQADQAGQARRLPDGGIRIEFDQPQRAVTPGQSVVFYDEDHCLGGGIIDISHSIAA
jgi:tRNA-specific 2-thiouridylase